MDLKTATEEQLRLMSDVFELRTQVTRGNGSQSGVTGVEPWTTGSRGEARSPIASAGDKYNSDHAEERRIYHYPG